MLLSKWEGEAKTWSYTSAAYILCTEAYFDIFGWCNRSRRSARMLNHSPIDVTCRRGVNVMVGNDRHDEEVVGKPHQLITNCAQWYMLRNVDCFARGPWTGISHWEMKYKKGTIATVVLERIRWSVRKIAAEIVMEYSTSSPTTTHHALTVCRMEHERKETRTLRRTLKGRFY